MDQFHQALKMFLYPPSKAEAQVFCRPGMSSVPCCLAQLLFTPEHHLDAQGINTSPEQILSSSLKNKLHTADECWDHTDPLVLENKMLHCVQRSSLCRMKRNYIFISLGFVQKAERKPFSSGYCRSQDSSLAFNKKRRYYSCHCWISAGERFSSIVSNIHCNRTTPVLLPLLKRIRHHPLQHQKKSHQKSQMEVLSFKQGVSCCLTCLELHF